MLLMLVSQGLFSTHVFLAYIEIIVGSNITGFCISCSVAKFLSTSTFSGAKTKATPKNNSTPAPSPKSLNKIFAAIPFASVDDEGVEEDEGGGGGGGGGEGGGAATLILPESLRSALHTIYYLLEDTLAALSSS